LLNDIFRQKFSIILLRTLKFRRKPP